MSTQPTPAPTAQQLTAKVRFFSLKTFEKVSQDIPVNFTPVNSVEEALTKAGSAETLLSAINAGFKRQAKLDAKHAATLGEDSISQGALAQFINMARTAKEYRGFSDRSAQTKKILEDLKTSAAKQAVLKSIASEFFGEEEDEDESDED